MLLDQDATRQHRKEAERKEETASRDAAGERIFPRTGQSKVSSFITTHIKILSLIQTKNHLYVTTLLQLQLSYQDIWYPLDASLSSTVLIIWFS